MTNKGWGFDPKNIDARVRPQDDFYHHAVGAWMKKATIPPTESWWGAFQILRYKTERQLRDLLADLDKRRVVKKGSPEQMIRDLYRSSADMKTRQKLGTKPIDPFQKKIDTITSREDLLETIAYFHKLGIGAVWALGLDQDAKKTDRYLLHLIQDGLGMPDREYYLLQGDEQKRVRAAYLAHMQALLRLYKRTPAEIEQITGAVMDIETKLARISMSKEDRRDAEKTYNKYSLAALLRLAPSIDWKLYFRLQSIPVPKEVVVAQPQFFKGINRLLTQISLEDWKRYLTWHLINDFASSLSPAFVRQSFAYYGVALMGAKKMKPLWRRALASVNGNLGELLGQLYVKKHFSPAMKKQVNAIVDDLFTAYAARLKKLDWMSPPTRRKALAKLDAMTRKIAYPDKWKSYRGLVIKEDDYVGNLIRIAEYEHKRMLKKLSGPVDWSEWFMTPQTVNAYCNQTMNEVVFPAAFLQFPFFDSKADDALNYGALGMTIGHEITHNFDDQGAKFDKRGNLKTWWTSADKSRFSAKGKMLEKQYNAYNVAPGINVNGKLTLGENIADLGGLWIAYDAYQLKLKRNGRKTIGGLTPEQRFFFAYAQNECSKKRPEFAKLLALNDPHSPAQFRVNGPLSNMPEFYEAFGVKKNDKLYRVPKNRAKIW
jgi:putative endopeptidase